MKKILTLLLLCAFGTDCGRQKAQINVPPPAFAVWKSMVQEGEVCKMIARYNARYPAKPLSDCGCTDTLTFDSVKVQIILDAMQQERNNEFIHHDEKSI